MERNNTLKLKCRVKFSFYLCLFLGVANINAQIIYTDIEPDFTSVNLGDQYNLDLNNDGTVDFSLKSYSEAYYDWLQIGTNTNGNGVLSVIPWYSNPVPFDIGRKIFNVASYTNGEIYESWGYFTIGDCFGGGGGCYYDWKDKYDKYLGLRFLINGQIHYGWARLDVSSYTQWVIRDYAYQATPNTAILAGQMVLDLEESGFKTVKIMVSNRQITIRNLPSRTIFNLYTINGQQFLHGVLTEINSTIDVQDLASGLYVIELITNNSISVTKRKLIIP